MAVLFSVGFFGLLVLWAVFTSILLVVLYLRNNGKNKNDVGNSKKFDQDNYRVERSRNREPNQKENKGKSDMNKETVDIINDMLDKMTDTMAHLPEIQQVDNLFNEMSPEMREKLSISLGVTFTDRLKNVTDQELEAVEKLREFQLRWSLYLNRLTMAELFIPRALEKALATEKNLMMIAQDSEKDFGPLHLEEGFNKFAKHLVAVTAEHLDGQYRMSMGLGETPAFPAHQALYLTAEAEEDEVVEAELIDVKYGRNGNEQKEKEYRR